MFIGKAYYEFIQSARVCTFVACLDAAGLLSQDIQATSIFDPVKMQTRPRLLGARLAVTDRHTICDVQPQLRNCGGRRSVGLVGWACNREVTGNPIPNGLLAR